MIFIILVGAAGILFGLAFYLWSGANDIEQMVREMHVTEMAVVHSATEINEESVGKASADDMELVVPVAVDAPISVEVPAGVERPKTRKIYHFSIPEEPEEGHATIVRMRVEHVAEENGRETKTDGAPSGTSSG